jgi:HPt (histidine-containing phosphotransfer) domain-containing protein
MNDVSLCDELGDEFVELQKEFLTMSRRRIVELLDLLEAARGGVPVGAPGEEFRRIAHSLRGAGGSYGFDAISEVAGLLEKAYIGGGTRDKLRQLIASLETVVEESECETPSGAGA